MSRLSVSCRHCRLILLRINASGAVRPAPGVIADVAREPGVWWLRCPDCGRERKFELRSPWVRAVA